MAAIIIALCKIRGNLLGKKSCVIFRDRNPVEDLKRKGACYMFIFGSILSPWAWILILVLALVLFGPGKLPELGKGLGKAIRGFKEEMKGKEDQSVE